MIASAIVAALHFLSILALGASLVSEHLLFRPDLSSKEVNKLARVDLVYGISAISVLVTGLLRWFYFDKTPAYYLRHPMFHLKLTLFVVMGVLSIYPTIQFLKWRRASQSQPAIALDSTTSRRIKVLMRAQLTLLAAIPFLATLIARGVGAR
jgi:putative membrane protein